MRGLNLSRLARASEGSFFKDQQSLQAANIRTSLSKTEIQTLRSTRNKPLPTVDTLSSISAQSAYSQLVKQSHKHAPLRVSSSSQLARRVQRSQSTAFAAHHPAAANTLDPSVMRVLGSGKLNVLADISTATPTPQRPLPGSEKYGEGAMLGMASLSIATSIVASVGLAAVLAVYFNPAIIDAIKARTTQFAVAMDASVGERIRQRVQRIKQDGPVLSDEKRQRVRKLMSGALGFSQNEPNDAHPNHTDTAQ
ncbi:hypothetical protein BWQ96_00616 [Gracilariopsis chorda]|uniref:Transmembrane protein n=1 Tax=Gracilariopsis chorda TaxID=448386 RepID=A0A2V3J535_9FLOR|nr:hypothetical protein BWQ96_00616 [Gracilariopsis chorda]|eukprot:PXF49546.1 hypothetical protein BWQ96_00616 [Gracilariopsis chorda]